MTSLRLLLVLLAIIQVSAVKFDSPTSTVLEGSDDTEFEVEFAVTLIVALGADDISKLPFVCSSWFLSLG